MIRLALLAFVFAAPAAAQDLVFSPEATEACLETGGAECIGRAANACMEETPGGSSTVVMGGCLAEEHEWWDARLNAAYGAAMQAAKSADAVEGARPLTETEALRTMQRAWITFRDARCDWEAVQWGGGTGAGPARMACLMRVTAEQALVLEARIGDR